MSLPFWDSAYDADRFVTDEDDELEDERWYDDDPDCVFEPCTDEEDEILLRLPLDLMLRAAYLHHQTPQSPVHG